MARITIEKIIYFPEHKTNGEEDFNANVLYRHGKKLKYARVHLCTVQEYATLSKNQHGQKPHDHSTRLMNAIGQRIHDAKRGIIAGW